MDRFNRRLREELHREFDSQVVDTPPPYRARYRRVGSRPVRPVPLRTAALVTAIFAVGVLVGLVYNSRNPVQPGPGFQLGSAPGQSASARATIPPPSPTAQPTTPAPRSTTSRRPSAPPPSASPAPPSFTDDFQADAVGADPPSGWHVDDGDWVGVVDHGGHVLRHSASQGFAHLSAGSPQWTDYAVSVDVTTTLLDLGYAGVAGRYQAPTDYYLCDEALVGGLELWVVKDGKRTLLGSSGISLDLSQRHSIGLEMRGSKLTCSLDGQPLLHATDSTFSAGRIALVASSGEAVDFDNVTLR